MSNIDKEKMPKVIYTQQIKDIYICPICKSEYEWYMNAEKCIEKCFKKKEVCDE